MTALAAKPAAKADAFELFDARDGGCDFPQSWRYLPRERRHA